MGWIFIVDGALPTWWHLGKSVQIKDTRVWETRDRDGIVQLGDSSKKKTKHDYLRLTTMVKRGIEQNLRSRDLEARNGRIQSNTLVKNQREQRRVHKGHGDSVRKKTNAGTMAISVPIATTPPAPAPEPSTHPQDVKNSERSKGPTGGSPSGRISRLPCKDHIEGTWCVSLLLKSGIHQIACCTRQKRDANSGKSALSHTVGLKNSQVKGPQRMAKTCSGIFEGDTTIGLYLKIWTRRDLHRFDGRAQPCRNQSDVFDPPKPYCAEPTVETKIHRSTEFAQVNLINESRTLQNLRIGLRKRQNDKTPVRLDTWSAGRIWIPQNWKQ